MSWASRKKGFGLLKMSKRQAETSAKLKELRVDKFKKIKHDLEEKIKQKQEYENETSIDHSSDIPFKSRSTSKGRPYTDKFVAHAKACLRSLSVSLRDGICALCMCVFEIWSLCSQCVSLRDRVCALSICVFERWSL